MHPNTRCDDLVACAWPEEEILTQNTLDTQLQKSCKAACEDWLKRGEASMHESFGVGAAHWHGFCKAVAENPADLYTAIKRFLTPITWQAPQNHAQSFFTGYYEPTLKGSLFPSKAYPFPLYALPDAGFLRRASRQEIYTGALKNHNLEIVYVENAIEAFFLEIQGSGRILFEDGRILRVGYAGQNGHPYTALGRVFLEHHLLAKDAISLQSLKDALYKYQHTTPRRALGIETSCTMTLSDYLMAHNASYVYFMKMSDEPAHINECDGPIGTQGLPLTPYRSLACDPAYWPMGTLALYDIPDIVPSSTLALLQDTGGAIKGRHRFDVFCGAGLKAEHTAGTLKHTGRCVMLIPKSGSPCA